MAFIRKHRGSRRALDNTKRPHAGREAVRSQNEGVVVHDFDGTEVFRTGTYGSELGDETSRGLVFSDSDGNATAELNQQNISLGDPIVGSVQSDNIVQQSNTTIIRYVDPDNGSDDNDGLAPVSIADTFNRTTAAGWGSASDGYHTWTKMDGTAADFTTATTPTAKIAMQASDTKSIFLNTGGAIAEEVYFTIQSDKAPSTGSMRAGVVFRGRTKATTFSGDAQGIFVRFQFTTTAAVPVVQIHSMIDGALTQLATANLAANFAVNTEYAVRAQIYDLAGTTYIRARAWPTSGAEPTSWSAGTGVCVASVSDETYLTNRGGQIGFYAADGAIANAPITLRFNAFTYHVLDLDLLTADDTSTVASDYYFTTTSTGPYATVNRAIRDIPAYNNGYVAVIISSGQEGRSADTLTGVVSETINLTGIVGGGLLVITGAMPYWLGGIQINGCNQNIVISGLDFSDTGGNSPSITLVVNVSRYVEVYQNIFDGNNGSCTSSVSYQQGSAGEIANNQLFDASANCLIVTGASYVFASNNTGSSVGGTNYRVANSILQSTGTQPTGTVACGTTAMLITNGGAGNYTVTASAPATGGGTTPVGSSKTTKTFSAKASGTYGTTYGTWATGDVTQGAYGGSQNHKGIWLYPDTLQAAISGKTIDAAYITLKRASGNGSSGEQTVYLCSFAYSTNPLSGDPGTALSGPTAIGTLKWGETKTFKLSAAVLAGQISDLKTLTSSHTRALGIYIGNGSPYVTLLGVGNFASSGKLKITYH